MTHTVRGTSWAHFYSPVADNYDLSLRVSHLPWEMSQNPSCRRVGAPDMARVAGPRFGGLNGEPTHGLPANDYRVVDERGYVKFGT